MGSTETIKTELRRNQESGVSLKAQVPSNTSYSSLAAQKIQITPIVKSSRVMAH